jgi:transposase
MTDVYEQSYLRRQQALRLRAEHPDWANSEIGKAMGVSGATIGRYLRQAPTTNARTALGRRVAAQAPAANEAQQTVLREQAFDLRLQGLSHGAIGRQMGFDGSTVKRWIDQEIEDRIEPRVHALRLLESARLDRYLAKLEPKIENGDPKAIGIANRISQRRSALLGLNAPIQIDATVHEVTEQDLELAEMVREAQAANAGLGPQLQQARWDRAVQVDPHEENP